MAAPAGEKLRTVLDYVPCEACLTQTVDDQELLCSICRRLDRQVGVRIAVKTTIILERPTEPASVGPVVIPPPQLQSPSLPAVAIRYREPGAPDPREPAPAAAIEIVLEPLDERPAIAAAETAPAGSDDVEGHLWDDVAEFTGFPSDLVSMTPATEDRYVAPREDAFESFSQAPAEAPVEETPVEIPQDDYVFRPPPEEEPVLAAREEILVEEEWLPLEEVPVQAREEGPSPWAPPAEELREEEIVETTSLVEEEPLRHESPFAPPPTVDEDGEALETTMVADDDVVETTIVDETPSSGSDLWRLRGFDGEAERALRGIGIESVAHLSGHDANELEGRTRISATRLDAWIDVADLQEEVGVPLDAASAIVAAGLPGPRGLREHETDDIVARVHANGGHVNAQDVRRWKRRA